MNAKKPNCVCHWCGKELYRQKQAVFVKFHFCDRTCKGEFQRTAKPVSREWLVEQYVTLGRTCPDIAREVGRDAKSVWSWLKDLGIPTRPRGSHVSGRKHNLLHGSGADNAFYGRKHSEETKAKLRAIAIETGRVPYDPEVGSYMKGRKGPDTPGWKGGITPERQALYGSPEWKKVARAIRKRDKHTCQRCGNVKRPNDGQSFDVHHIVGFACVEKRMDLDNLVYLCECCHYWVHSAENTENLFIERE